MAAHPETKENVDALPRRRPSIGNWLAFCLLLSGCSDAMLRPPTPHLTIRSVLKGIGQPCPGCGGAGMAWADDLTVSTDQLNAMITWADQHPNICDPANLDGDSADDDCTTGSQ